MESKEERRRGREFTESCDLVNSGGDRAGRRERRDGCLLRKCQGDTGDYKKHFLKSLSQTKYHKNHSFLPFRLLLTSSKAVRRLLRRNEMHGWNQRALDQEAHDQRVVANIRWLHSSFTCGFQYLITGWLHSS